MIGSHTERIIFELYKGVKLRSKAVKAGDVSSRPQRAALLKFGEVARFIKPSKCRKYATSVSQQLVDYTTQPEPDEALLETMSQSIDKIAQALIGYLERSEVGALITAFLGNLSNASGAVRRAVCKSAVSVVRHYHAPDDLFTSIVEILGVTSERAVWCDDEARRAAAPSSPSSSSSPSPAPPADPADSSPPSLAQAGQAIRGVAYWYEAHFYFIYFFENAIFFKKTTSLLQCIRLSAELGGNAPLHEHALARHINFVAAFALEFLFSDDHNVVGLTLELLHAALLHYGGLRATWRACVLLCVDGLSTQAFGHVPEQPAALDAPLAASLLLSPQSRRTAPRRSVLFDKVSVKAAALAAFAELAEHLPRETLRHTDAVLAASVVAPGQHASPSLRALLPLFDHDDPLVRAHAALVCGSTTRGLLRVTALTAAEHAWIIAAVTALRNALGDSSAVALRQTVRAIGDTYFHFVIFYF